MQNESVMKFTGFRKVQTEEFIKSKLNQWIDDSGVWCVEDKLSNEFIGWFMLKETDKNFPELGFMLAQNKWNQGYATEVSKEIINYGLNILNYKKVFAKVDIENTASISVLNKLGMQKSEEKDTLLIFEISNV